MVDNVALSISGLSNAKLIMNGCTMIWPLVPNGMDSGVPPLLGAQSIRMDGTNIAKQLNASSRPAATELAAASPPPFCSYWLKRKGSLGYHELLLNQA